MSLKDKINQDAENNREIVTQSADWLKFKDGKNTFQILVEPEVIVERYQVGICFPGCGYKGTTKYLTYVEQDGKILKAKLPLSIVDVIAELELSDRFKFEGYPMPYELIVTATDAGTKNVKYAVLPGNDKTVSPVILSQLRELDTPAKIIKYMQDKQREEIKSGRVKIPGSENEPGYDASFDNIAEEPIIDFDEEKPEIPF